jgi:uncharacterized alpha-E superfamily protein
MRTVGEQTSTIDSLRLAVLAALNIADEYHILKKKYDLLAGGSGGAAPTEVGQWHAVLRSASGYHAFRRVYSSRLTPALVAEFLLFNPSFPRSLFLCVREVENAFSELQSRYALRQGNAVAEHLDGLRAILGAVSIEEVLRGGLHEFLDLLQLRLIAITRGLSEAFFGRRAAPVSGRQQSQNWLPNEPPATPLQRAICNHHIFLPRTS